MVRGGCQGLAACVLVLAGLQLSVCRADDASASRQYGAGVHEFFQGRYHQAIEHFDRAVGVDGRDARAYLFRGLAKQRLGWTGDAHTDFLLGSQLEVALKRRDVGTVLERVQGADRLTVERYRRQARTLPKELVQSVVPPSASAASALQPARPSTAGSSVRPAPNRTAITPGSLTSDSSDPFAEGAPGLLGRGEIEAANESAGGVVAAPRTAQPDAADPADPFGTDAPIGTGVAAEAESDADMQDPFDTDAADQDPFAADSTSPADGRAASGSPAAARAATASPAASGAQPGGARGGAFGAALRAFSRSVVPADGLRQGTKLLEGIRGGSSAPQTVVAGDEDPFAESTSASGDAPAADDPFAPTDTPDTDGTTAEPSADPQQPPADDSGDPFVDDDPFKS